MKIKCTHCGEDISKEIRSNFEDYTVGRIVCPHCHTKQKRYISESELLMYFGISALAYVLLFSIIVLIYDLVGVNPLAIFLIVGLFIIGYFFTINFASAIYKYAFFKKDLQNIVFKEDKKAIQKHLRWQFIMFMLAAFMLGYDPEFKLYFFIAIIAFTIIVGVKVYLSIKNERNGIKERLNDKK